MNKRLIHALSLCFIIMMTIVAHSQSNFSKNLFVRADAHFGFVIPEYKHFTYLVNEPVKSVEVSLSKQTTGK